MATRSSAARALAIIETPGLETVHCWSNVRSLVDLKGKRGTKYRVFLLASTAKSSIITNRNRHFIM